MSKGAATNGAFSSKPRGGWHYFAVPGACLVGALSGPLYFWAHVAAFGLSATDANIGAGLGLMWTAAWGLPWSIWPWTVDDLNMREALFAFTSCALFNVALVSIMAKFLYSRATRRISAAAQVRANERSRHS